MIKIGSCVQFYNNVLARNQMFEAGQCGVVTAESKFLIQIDGIDAWFHRKHVGCISQYEYSRYLDNSFNDWSE